MSDPARLPQSDFNMPPGVRAADIPGNELSREDIADYDLAYENQDKLAMKPAKIFTKGGVVHKVETISAHTPAPWTSTPHAIEERGLFSAQVYSAQDVEVANVISCNNRIAVENARLIAAAPDLLEACKVALAVCRRDNDKEGTALELRLVAAIAKAQGEKS